MVAKEDQLELRDVIEEIATHEARGDGIAPSQRLNLGA
jgi:hypothetical protein